MTETKSAEQSAQPIQPAISLGQRAKRAGLYFLFGTILFIPRIRRLRRRVWAWTLVRLGAAACGCWLVWRYAHLRTGVAALAGGLILLLFALLVRARPVQKSVDAIADELGALIVLNGGTLRESPESVATRHTQIFVHPQKVMVHGPGNRHLFTIPLAKFRSMEAHASTNGRSSKHQPWEVEIVWLAEAPRNTKFIYEGPFAEHLAQVTESTLRSQWKKELPIFQAKG
jgi:hypothetical protein